MMTRKIGLISACILITMQLSYSDTMAQGTGVNTSTPDLSAALDVQGQKVGVLVPRVALLNRSDKATVTTPALGLLLYNTNPGMYAKTGYYFNTGTPASPEWRSVSELRLPYRKVGAENTMLSLENAKGATSNALHTYSVQGYALDSYGKIRLAGNNNAPGLGKELTSDGQGNATWEGAVAFRASGIVSGSEKLFGGLALEERIPFSTEEYDLSGNYSNATGNPQNALVAPVKGIYSFNVGLSWIAGSDVSALVVLELKRLRAGVVTKLGQIIRQEDDGSLTLASDALLEANDQVFVTIRHTDAQKFITMQNPSFFTGKLMIRQ